MWKKVIVSILVLTVVAAVAMAVFEMQTKTAVSAGAATTQSVDALATSTPAQAGRQMRGAGNAGAQQSQKQPQNQSLDNVGEPWSATATIVSLGEVGMTVTLDDGSQIYVELGPSFYWQAQGALAVGDAITIDGFYNGDQYHAATITKADGAVLALRSETGQPLWSGGASGSGTNGAGHGGQGGGGVGQVQVAPEDWVTIKATVTAVNRNGLTIETTDGETLVLSFGRPGFWQEQAIQFASGDAVEVQGFWQDGQFQSGQITKTATGERLLLRDPNGRPLWGGPGRNGGQGKGRGASTNG